MQINTKPILINGSIALFVWSIWYFTLGSTGFTIIQENWPISVTMVFGSMIAGATSEGGGAVAFPVFTKLLFIQPEDARVFSLAIQSVGMTAASLTIILMRIPICWRAIVVAGLAGIPGIILSTLVIAPMVPPVIVRISFTLMLTSFAITLWLLNRDDRHPHEDLPKKGLPEHGFLIIAGFIGGIMSGMVGNGIDIITFALLVLLFRMSEKIATPTSVVLMASNSIVGFMLHLFVTDGFTPEVQSWWLAAVPIVVVGAPLGALICSWMLRHHIAYMLIFLIMIELVTSIILIPMTAELMMWSAMLIVILTGLNYLLYRSQHYLKQEDDVDSDNMSKATASA